MSGPPGWLQRQQVGSEAGSHFKQRNLEPALDLGSGSPSGCFVSFLRQSAWYNVRHLVQESNWPSRKSQSSQTSIFISKSFLSCAIFLASKSFCPTTADVNFSVWFSLSEKVPLAWSILARFLAGASSASVEVDSSGLAASLLCLRRLGLRSPTSSELRFLFRSAAFNATVFNKIECLSSL